MGGYAPFSPLISLVLLYRMGFRLGRLNVGNVIIAIRSNSDLFINQIVPNLYNSLSSILLGFWHSSVANGIFDAGNRFNNVASQFTSILSRVFFPYLSRNMNRHSFYIKFHLGISVLTALLLYIFAPLIIKLFFTKDFVDAVPVLRIMSISLIFLSLFNIFGANYLILLGREHVLRNCTIVSSVIGFVCMLPLVYFFSYIGAAWSICLSRGLLAITITYKAISLRK